MATPHVRWMPPSSSIMSVSHPICLVSRSPCYHGHHILPCSRHLGSPVCGCPGCMAEVVLCCATMWWCVIPPSPFVSQLLCYLKSISLFPRYCAVFGVISMIEVSMAGFSFLYFQLAFKEHLFFLIDFAF